MNSILNPNIEGAIEKVALLSYSINKSEKKSVQELMDSALDELLLFTTFIEKKTVELKMVNDILRALTWIDEPVDDDSLVKINMIEVITKEINIKIQAEITSIKSTTLPEMCPSLLEKYFEESESLIENIELIHEIFFELRQDEEFLDLVSKI
jgi:hypothetical protein